MEQFDSLIATLLRMTLFRPRFTRSPDMLVSLRIYAGAKALEAGHRAAFSAGRIVSGYTLKHLAAAISAYWILRIIELRVRLQQPTTRVWTPDLGNQF
jgi:hypothetical protein